MLSTWLQRSSTARSTRRQLRLLRALLARIMWVLLVVRIMHTWAMWFDCADSGRCKSGHRHSDSATGICCSRCCCLNNRRLRQVSGDKWLHISRQRAPMQSRVGSHGLVVCHDHTTCIAGDRCRPWPLPGCRRRATWGRGGPFLLWHCCGQVERNRWRI